MIIKQQQHIVARSSLCFRQKRSRKEHVEISMCTLGCYTVYVYVALGVKNVTYTDIIMLYTTIIMTYREYALIITILSCVLTPQFCDFYLSKIFSTVFLVLNGGNAYIRAICRKHTQGRRARVWKYCDLQKGGSSDALAEKFSPEVEPLISGKKLTFWSNTRDL